ncbi:MAG: helix-turn-helix transcriptional regulator [Limisphaerales bacterium]
MNNRLGNIPAPSNGTRSARRQSGEGQSAWLRESAFWQSAGGTWRRLFGGFDDAEVNIEWHDVQPVSDLEWSRSFHPGSVELCLNLSGHGSMRRQEASVCFEPLTAGFYLPGAPSLIAWRQAGERHQFVTVRFPAHYLRHHLAQCDGALHPLVEQLMQGITGLAGLPEVRRLTVEEQQLVGRLVHPPVVQGARALWYQSKVLELMAQFFFERREENELFCDRQKRLARGRVERVIAILRGRLAEPPSLEEIGRQAGCSPFYLSRTFSREMAMTIPQYLRKIRMERAAELLRSGTHNVTEAAMEVGYNSLSHFSLAFCQTMGCCPAIYPHAELRHRNSDAAQRKSLRTRNP